MQTVQFRSVDRSGGARTLGGKIYWKRLARDTSGTLLRIEAPADLRDSAYLIRQSRTEQDLFLYLSGTHQVHHIEPIAIASSLFGTDFSYEDFYFVRGMMGESRLERLPDERVEGFSTFVVKALPRFKTSAYQRIVIFADQKRCLPIRVEFYERNDRLRKVMRADPSAIHSIGSVWFAGSVTLRDLRHETETRLVTEDIELDIDLPDWLFTRAGLDRQH